MKYIFIKERNSGCRIYVSINSEGYILLDYKNFEDWGWSSVYGGLAREGDHIIYSFDHLRYMYSSAETLKQYATWDELLTDNLEAFI